MDSRKDFDALFFYIFTMIFACVLAAFGALFIAVDVKSGWIFIIISALFLFNSKKIKELFVANNDEEISNEGEEKTKKAVSEKFTPSSKNKTDYHSIKSVGGISAVKIVPDLTAKKSGARSISNMPFFDSGSIRKSTARNKIFPLVVIDIETTGLNCAVDKIIEISAIKYESNFIPTNCFYTLVNPGKPIPISARAINNITDDMVLDAPKFHEIKRQFEDYICGCNLVGHNLNFDMKFLFKAGVNFTNEVSYYDTLSLGSDIVPREDVNNYSLSSLCDYFDIIKPYPHCRYSDCYAIAQLFETIVKKVQNR